jgi:hypothetical protein
MKHDVCVSVVGGILLQVLTAQALAPLTVSPATDNKTLRQVLLPGTTDCLWVAQGTDCTNKHNVSKVK